MKPTGAVTLITVPEKVRVRRDVRKYRKSMANQYINKNTVFECVYLRSSRSQGPKRVQQSHSIHTNTV